MDYEKEITTLKEEINNNTELIREINRKLKSKIAKLKEEMINKNE